MAKPKVKPPSAQEVIAALARGELPEEVAAQIPDPQISYGWTEADQVEGKLNQCKEEALWPSRARLVQLLPQCVEIVERELKEGNLKMALAVLSGLGLFSVPRLKVDVDADAIVEAIEMRRTSD